MIPKIIHLCWLSGDKYPTKIAKCIVSWKRILPDYKIMIWDKNSFDMKSSKWVKQAFEKKKYAFAADYIRFYALYNYGGIYLDSDVEVIKSFDDLLSYPYFMGAEKAGTIEAAIIGAEKGELWIKECLDYYDNREFVMENGDLDIRKLPDIMVEQIGRKYTLRQLTLDNSKTYREHCNRNQNEIFILPDEFFSPKVFDSREVIITPYTYAIHHYQNSWFSPKAKIYYRTRSMAIRIFGYSLVRKAECFLFPQKFNK